MAVLQRYDRQSRINNWDQERISRTEVYLVGSGVLSDIMLVDLLSLGFNRVYRTGQSNSFQFDKINPEVYLEQTGENITTLQDARRVFSEANPKKSIVVECSNEGRSKYFSSLGAREKNLNFFSTCTTEDSFSFTTKQIEESLIQYHLSDFDKVQGFNNSLIASAILSDEIRKMIMPIEGDVRLEEYRYSGIKEVKSLDKKILQIGAGAIGTFSALALAKSNVQMAIVDFDTIEESNLNRQFLFYDSLGKNKAETLAERIKEYNPGCFVKGINKKITSDFHPKNFDFVFSCVDNNEARYFMNESARKYNVPLINAGSSTGGCGSTAYYPGKTACLDCQLGFKLSDAMKPKEEVEVKRKTGECFHPSLIISNQIAGALMISSMLKSIEGNYQKLEYSSGFGIDSGSINESCFRMCKSQEQK